MKIAVIGSWRAGDREWSLRGTHTEFEEACKSIGRKLGFHRQIVVVGGESTATADLHIVRGLIDELKGKSIPYPLIEVIRPSDDILSYNELAKTHPGLFSYHSHSQIRWIEAHLLALRESDVVITIAGMKGTYQAGLAAIVANKKLVPVASFGGASERLSALLGTLGELRGINEYRQLIGPWTSHSVEIVTRLAGIGLLPKILIIHGRSKDWQKVKNWLQNELHIPDVIVMQQEVFAGLTLPEKFEKLAANIDKAIAVVTPDDIGGLVDCESFKDLRPRARQNIWLEIGWFWGRLGREKILVLSKGDVEFPSDLTGIEVYPYLEDPMEKSNKLITFLDVPHLG